MLKGWVFEVDLWVFPSSSKGAKSADHLEEIEAQCCLLQVEMRNYCFPLRTWAWWRQDKQAPD
jgi:hypothetical protein